MSNEINTVQGLWNKFTQTYWHNRAPAEAITYNEVPLDIFAISGSYGGAECFRLDDISKKETITYTYNFAVSPPSIWIPALGGSATFTVVSNKYKYVNGVHTETIEVPYDVGNSIVNGNGWSYTKTQNSFTVTRNQENTSTSAPSAEFEIVQGESVKKATFKALQYAATFSTREDLYAQPSQWQWNYDQGGSGVARTFEVISETVSLRNGQVISRSPKNFSYSVVGDYNAQFYAGKDSSTIIRAFPVMQNNTSTSYYADILLTRSGATDFRIGLYQQKRY